MTAAKTNIEIPQDKIQEFCRRWRIKEFAIFGSTLRNDFRPESDVDVLVTFQDEAPWGLFEFVEMMEELQEIFGRNVDLIEKEALRNPFRRREILSHCQVVYAA
ncbi:MAG: nucleotidyltransferase family protein [Candidatus Aminicenantes bacterium]|jgi:predicted nucleotidyltransferase|nr:nucleotidyltransferase family protein [Candidatus Aminicenantes bacterium]